MEDETRLKQVFLDPDNLVRTLNWFHDPQGTFLVLGGPGVPEDAKVRNCYYDPNHRGLIVVLSHPSFDPVPAGSQTPWLHIVEGSARFIVKKADQAFFVVDPSDKVTLEPGEIVDVQPGFELMSRSKPVLEIEQTTPWSEASSAVPLDDICVAMHVFEERFGVRPDCLEIGRDTYADMKATAQVRERLKYSPADDKTCLKSLLVATLNLCPRIFDIADLECPRLRHVDVAGWIRPKKAIHCEQTRRWPTVKDVDAKFELRRKLNSPGVANQIGPEEPTPVESAPAEEESGGDYFRRVMGMG